MVTDALGPSGQVVYRGSGRTQTLTVTLYCSGCSSSTGSLGTSQDCEALGRPQSYVEHEGVQRNGGGTEDRRQATRPKRYRPPT